MSAGTYGLIGLGCGIAMAVLLVVAVCKAASEASDDWRAEREQFEAYQLTCLPDPLETLWKLPSRDPEQVR